MYNAGGGCSKIGAAVLLLVSFFPAYAQQSALRQAARLDAEHKCAEAERFYQQALAQGPPSLAVWNNLGNHYLLCGDPEKARSSFERVLKLDPRHANANLQLARIATDQHQGGRALEYLSRVDDPQPAVRLLRAEALHWAGKPAEALTLLDGVQKQIAGDQRLLFLYGLTCGRIGAYARAEAAFTALLVQHPDDFDILLNLGRAAARAEHYDRAQRALEVALKLHPDSVESLVGLGEVSLALRDYARAVYLLAQASKLAPQRPEILLELAHAAQGGEYYGDAALAYDEYLRLRPGDAAARRDRALVSAYTDARKEEGLKGLAGYVRDHPDDPLGYYDLAQFTWRDQPQVALDQLARASRLDPKLVAAYLDRGWLLNRIGRPSEAVPDLLRAVELDPRNFRALDQLGLAYSSLERPADAEKVLRKALALAPDDPDILMHLGRTLMDLGQEDEGQQYLSKFQRIRQKKVRGPWTQAGMIESATLSAPERTKREIERLRQDARTHPDDPELQLHFASLLLADGRVDEATVEFRLLLTRNAENRVWQEAGDFLLGFEQYPLAREFLERAAAARPAANLGLAVAVFSIEGPAAALKVLDRVPEAERTGDYLLLKAKILDAAGETDESEKVLDQGLRFSVSQPRIAQQAALLLLRHNRRDAALDLLTRAAGTDQDLLLTRAIVLGLMGRNADAEKALKDIESQWPEWDRPYLAHGLLLERAQPREAAQKLRTAVALGSREITARCALARLKSPASPDPQCSCAGGLETLLFPACTGP